MSPRVWHAHLPHMFARKHMLCWLTIAYRQPDPPPNSRSCIYPRRHRQLIHSSCSDLASSPTQLSKSPYSLNHDLCGCGTPWQRMTQMAKKRTGAEAKIIVLSISISGPRSLRSFRGFLNASLIHGVLPPRFISVQEKTYWDGQSIVAASGQQYRPDASSYCA